MNILFLAQTYPDEILPSLEKNSKVILDYAAHNLGSAIIKGMKENNVKIHVVNTPHVGSYPPYYRTPVIPSYKNNGLESIGFLNFSYLKRLSILRQQRKLTLKWCKCTAGRKVVFLYNFEALAIVSDIIKKYPDVRVVLLVTDLIEYQSTGMTPLKRINRIVDKFIGCGIQIYKYLELVDGFILLAPKMSENLCVGKRPWVQIEGIYNNDNNLSDVPKNPKKVLFYSGNLGKRYGICKLLDAFSEINDKEYELQICGGGDGLDIIKEYESKDNRIKYLGIVPRSEVQKLQQAATVLVNPRNSNDAYTMYSFPSKTMEYLASGTPVIMSHLKSIPQEYDEHIFYVDDESIEGWARKIQEVCNIAPKELIDFGRRAQNFIMKEKTPRPQVKKILDFIDKL